MQESLRAKMGHIAHAVAEGRYRYSLHAAQQRIARGIRRHEIEQAIAAGEVIEDYPAHHYGPACLILGRTADGRPLHVICSLRTTVDLITVYEPSSNEWESDWRTRRQHL